MRKFGKCTPEELYNHVMRRFCAEEAEPPTWAQLSESESLRIPIDIYKMVNALKPDLKVEFDLENWECQPSESDTWAGLGIRSLPNGLTYWAFLAGGDWEHPVCWIVYWDGKKVRAYVPTHGNPWNRKTKQAYGNDDKADIADAKKQYPDFPADETTPAEWVEFDWDHVLFDIVQHFEPVR